MKKVLIRFLKYWKKRNYDKMFELCQKTWKHNHTKGELKSMFVKLGLSDFTIGESESVGNLEKVKVKVIVDGEERDLSINLICETAPYKPTRNGVWGVNPITAISVKNESVTKELSQLL